MLPGPRRERPSWPFPGGDHAGSGDRRGRGPDRGRSRGLWRDALLVDRFDFWFEIVLP